MLRIIFSPLRQALRKPILNTLIDRIRALLRWRGASRA